MHKQKAENITFTDSIYSNVTVDKMAKMHFTSQIIIHCKQWSSKAISNWEETLHISITYGELDTAEWQQYIL